VSEPQPKTAAQMVAEAKGRIENLTPAQVAAETPLGGPSSIAVAGVNRP
jgi:hypothetical protein